MTQRLNQSEIRELIVKAQAGQREAMAQVVEENLALVKYLVKRFSGTGRDWDDLYQLGCMGLVKAIRNFNTAFEVCFSTYAVPVILGEVRRFLRDDGPMRVSRSIRENARHISAFADQYRLNEGRDPTVSEMARAAGISEEDALLAIESMRPTRSLSEPAGRDSTMTLADTLGEDQMEEVDKKLLIHQLLATLQGNEKELLVRRYFDSQTQSQIAEAFGMTQVQVSRLEKKLLQKLRETVREPA